MGCKLDLEPAMADTERKLCQDDDIVFRPFQLSQPRGSGPRLK